MSRLGKGHPSVVLGNFFTGGERSLSMHRAEVSNNIFVLGFALHKMLIFRMKHITYIYIVSYLKYVTGGAGELGVLLL